jgi:hypothetical protein
MNPEQGNAKEGKAGERTVPAEPVSEPAPLPAGPRTDDEISKPQKCSAEVLAWADRQFSDAEVIAGVREVRETGGLELTEFIREIDQVLSPDD